MSGTFDGQAIIHFLCLFRSVLLSEHGIDHSLNLPHLHHLQGLFPTGHRQGSTLAQKGELFNYRSQEGERGGGGFLYGREGKTIDVIMYKKGHVDVKRTREYLNLNVNPFHRGRVQTRGSKLTHLFPKFSSKYIVMLETLAVR